MRVVLALTAALLVTGCGGSGASPEAEVKDVYADFVEALIAEKNGDACAMTTDVGGCLAAIGLAQGFLGESNFESLMPDDWRDRLENAEVTFSDENHATIPPLPGDDPTEFVRQDGEWKLVWDSVGR